MLGGAIAGKTRWTWACVGFSCNAYGSAPTIIPSAHSRGLVLGVSLGLMEELIPKFAFVREAIDGTETREVSVG